MTRRNLILVLADHNALQRAGADRRTGARRAKVATGFVANILCSETFVSGLRTGPDVFRNHRRDARRQADHLGDRLQGRPCAQGRHGDIARPRPQPCRLPRRFWLLSRPWRCGRRCLVLPSDGKPSHGAVARYRRAVAGRACKSSRLAAARSIAPSPSRSSRRSARTKAVVVVKDGRVVAERYADGYGIDTPILGFSATKSVTSALTGILVRKGALTLDQPAPVAAWQGRRRSEACDHGRSAAAPYRGAGARQLAAGFARRWRSSRSTG